MVLFRAAALGAALWATAAPAQALEMRLVGSTLHLSGPLGWGSHHGFKAFVDSQPKGAIRVVALDSGGGSVESAQEIGRRLAPCALRKGLVDGVCHVQMNSWIDGSAASQLSRFTRLSVKRSRPSSTRKR